MHTTAKKPYKGTGMEGWLARWYARTRGNDLADFRQQAAAVAGRLPRGQRQLPPCSKSPPARVSSPSSWQNWAIFRSPGSTSAARWSRSPRTTPARAGVQVDFRLGDAAAMPFPAGSFDFVYCSAAFKNFSQPVAALNEMHRVLRPGGEALVVDLRKDVSLSDIDQYVRRSGRGRLDAWMTLGLSQFPHSPGVLSRAIQPVGRREPFRLVPDHLGPSDSRPVWQSRPVNRSADPADDRSRAVLR